MLQWSRRLLRRPRTPYVVKYLEGIPTPATLLDHLAGANLASGSSTSFFTTVPRYLNVQHDDRLSKLFFHHVLYPAGGARKPTQAVVVRGGRSVVPCRPRRVTAGATARRVNEPSASASQTTMAAVAASVSMSATTRSGTTAGNHGPATHTLQSTLRRNPLAVPPSQLGHATTTATDATAFSPEQSSYNCVRWGRSDRARRPYFYAPHTSRDAESGGGFRFTPGSPSVLVAPPLRNERGVSGQQREQHTRWPSSTSSAAGPSSLTSATADKHAVPSPGCSIASSSAIAAAAMTQPQRSVTDEALARLRGVVEHAFRSDLQRAEKSNGVARVAVRTAATSKSPERLMDRLSELAVNPSLGLIGSVLTRNRGAHGEKDEAENDDWVPAAQLPKDISSPSASSSRDTTRQLLQRVARQQATQRNGVCKATAPFAVYVQVGLPYEAVAVIPVEPSSSSALHEEKDAVAGAHTRREIVSRLAGGLEPLLPFAVGTPLQRFVSDSSRGAKETQNEREGESETGERRARKEVRDAAVAPFSHITCLVRLTGSVSVETTASAEERETANGEKTDEAKATPEGPSFQSPSATVKKGPGAVAVATLEPWRLGGPALDPVLRYKTRTLSEASTERRTFSSVSGHTDASLSSPPLMLGRTDGESYLIPQRELLLLLHVPPSTQRLCEEQNASRVARQILLGHAAAGASIATTSTARAAATVSKNNKALRPAPTHCQENASGLGLPLSPALRAEWGAGTHKGENGVAPNGFGFLDGPEPVSAGATLGTTPSHTQPLRDRHSYRDDYNGYHPRGDESDAVDPGLSLRTTADRLLHYRLRNAQAAMCTGEMSASTSTTSAKRTENKEKEPPVLTYEVRALPGDAVFIPAGWGYTVKRIVGTALVDMAGAASSPSTGATTLRAADTPTRIGSAGLGRNQGVHVFSNRSLALTRSPTPQRPTVSNSGSSNTRPAAHDRDAQNSHTEKKLEDEQLAIDDVSVDAFVLVYKPYPFLSKEQAGVYISANYVHKGVDEFYEKGGNPLFYRYE